MSLPVLPGIEQLRDIEGDLGADGGGAHDLPAGVDNPQGCATAAADIEGVPMGGVESIIVGRCPRMSRL